MQKGRHGRVLPVKFYRLDPGDIERIATTTGWIRPAPDPLLAAALGQVYEERWTHRGSYLVPATPAKAPVVPPPGIPADEFEAIVASNLRDVDIPFRRRRHREPRPQAHAGLHPPQPARCHAEDGR